MKQFVRSHCLFLFSWNACKNLTDKIFQGLLSKKILNLRILDFFYDYYFLFIYVYTLHKNKQSFKTITRRVIYFAKFVTRTFHFWGHLTIHYAGEICMCPFFPPFCSWREKDRSFVCALLFSVSRYILKLVQDLNTKFGIHTKMQLWLSIKTRLKLLQSKSLLS